ncbi:MAG: serine hydrolase, partial [Deinococcales bacterium]
MPRLLRRLHLPMLLVSAAAGAQPVGDALDARALAGFFDGAVPPLMSEHRVPGAVVAVVAGGEVRLLQGFGAAQLDPERRATPDTPFATGSVAKLFVWTSVMQLVERGELDLDADVNDYLDFAIPATFDQPITLQHLLTHTPGFEDRPLIGLFFDDLGRMRSLREALVRNLPARLRPPGEETAYSNYGSALAGYIIERVSGMPYDVYVDRRVLTPLGMTRSSLRRELPPELAFEAAVGYTPEGQTGYRAHGREYMELYPAGAMVMSAGDAAQFMVAYLGDGAAETGRILQPATVTQMRGTLFTNLPGLPGNAYGFWEGAAHGERILGHDGDTMRFHTKLALLPERGVGLYLATNAPGGVKLRAELWEAFLDRFYPATPVALAQDGMPMTRYAGLYGSNRVAATTAGKVAALFQNLAVQVDDDALVTVRGEERRWLPQGGGVFADAEREGAELVFRDDGGLMAVYVGEAPMEVYRRLRWFERPTF